jgi:superfamily II DNA or RNA helicase
MVKIVIGNVYSKIVGHLPEEVHLDLRDGLSYKVHNAKYMPLVKAKKWDGVVRLYKKNNGQSFYTGLMSLVRDVLKKHGIEYQIQDARVIPERNLPDLTFNPPHKYEERDYQTFTIDRSQQFTRGVLSVCTGGGKTVIVTKLIAELKTAPFIFYVLTNDLLDQAYETLSAFLNVPIGRIGGGEYDIQDINVCTIQTAIRALNSDNAKFKINEYQFDDEDAWDKDVLSSDKSQAIVNLIENAKGIYFDETHHAAAKTCKEVLEASKQAYWRFGGSATPVREQGDEIMIQAMFGSKIVEISASYLIKKGVLVKPYIYFVPVDSKNSYSSWKKVYESSIVKNDAFNDHVAETARHLISIGASTLILVQHYPQGEYIQAQLPGVEFVTGKRTKKQRKQCLDDMRTGKAKCLIATSLADEGVDIPALDAVIMAGGGASVTRINQRIGRTLRIDKSDPKDKSVVICYDHNAKFLHKHTGKIKRILSKEPEFVVRDSKGQDFINSEIDGSLGFGKDTDCVFEL